MTDRSVHILGSPGFLVGLLLLLSNDFVFKEQFHNGFTGKLSDFAGLFVSQGIFPDPSGYSKINLHASERSCANIKFHNLNRYKHTWSGVFRDTEVAPFLRRLLKSDYRLLISSLKSVSYPEDSLSFVDQKGVLTLRGFVPGLGTIMEAMLVVDRAETYMLEFSMAIDSFLVTARNTLSS